MSNLTEESKRFNLLPGQEANADAVLKRKCNKTSSLTGCVIDCRHDKVNHIKVLLFGCESLYETFTNKEGFFWFENVCEGKYSVILPLYCIQKYVNICGRKNCCRIKIHSKQRLLFFKKLLYKALHVILKKRRG